MTKQMHLKSYCINYNAYKTDGAYYVKIISHTSPIKVRSCSSLKDIACWPIGILFNAKARHLNASFPAKLKIKGYIPQ